MSHPENKRERFLCGKRKGSKRVKLFAVISNNYKTKEEVAEALEKFSRYQRDTTKLCGKRCCANPRKHEKEITLQEKKFAERQKLID